MQYRSYNCVWALILLLTALAGLTGCLLNRLPIAALNAAVISGPAPLDIAFDLSHCKDPDEDGIFYKLDFGDGSNKETGDNFNIIVHHTYQTSGTFIATLHVTDTEGNQAEDRLTITVSDAGPPVGLSVGETAPDFTAHTTDGGEITLSDYRSLIVLLEFWGAWCPPCKASMPHLQNLYDRFSESGLVVIAVSTDQTEQAALEFLIENGYGAFISVWEPGGKSGNPIAQLYGVSSSEVGIPRTFLLDRQGVIRYVGHPDNLRAEAVEGIL